ncbi:hypothetical protein, partial [Lactiplantibacillus pentosus]
NLTLSTHRKNNHNILISKMQGSRKKTVVQLTSNRRHHSHWYFDFGLAPISILTIPHVCKHSVTDR